MPSLLSQFQRPSFVILFVEKLEESKDQLLALPDSQGQILSNQELFDNILKDARHAISARPRWPPTDSDDDADDSEDDSESVLSPGVGDF